MEPIVIIILIICCCISSIGGGYGYYYYNGNPFITTPITTQFTTTQSSTSLTKNSSIANTSEIGNPIKLKSAMIRNGIIFGLSPTFVPVYILMSKLKSNPYWTSLIVSNLVQETVISEIGEVLILSNGNLYYTSNYNTVPLVWTLVPTSFQVRNIGIGNGTIVCISVINSTIYYIQTSNISTGIWSNFTSSSIITSGVQKISISNTGELLVLLNNQLYYTSSITTTSIFQLVPAINSNSPISYISIAGGFIVVLSLNSGYFIKATSIATTNFSNISSTPLVSLNVSDGKDLIGIDSLFNVYYAASCITNPTWYIVDSA